MSSQPPENLSGREPELKGERDNLKKQLLYKDSPALSRLANPSVDIQLLQDAWEGKCKLPWIQYALALLELDAPHFIRDLAQLHEAMYPRTQMPPLGSGSKTSFRTTNPETGEGKTHVLETRSYKMVLYDVTTHRLWDGIISVMPDAVQLTPLETVAYDYQIDPDTGQIDRIAPTIPVPLPPEHKPWSFRVIKGRLSKNDQLYLETIGFYYGRMDDEARRSLGRFIGH